MSIQSMETSLNPSNPVSGRSRHPSRQHNRSSENQIKHLGSATNDSREEPYATTIPQYPVTVARRPFVLSEHDTALTNPGLARVNIAASAEHPNGTTEDDYGEQHQEQTVLVQHCDYFDIDHDGIIWPQDTYIGCRKWGECVTVAYHVSL